MKHFKVKFDDFSCSQCLSNLYIPNIYKALQDQYEEHTGADGYFSVLTAQCDCGHKYKIYCNCHEYNDDITVCVYKIIHVPSIAKG